MEARKSIWNRTSSIKRPPIVKQTKASLLRMIKTNPSIITDDNTREELRISVDDLERVKHAPLVRKTMYWDSMCKNKNIDLSVNNNTLLKRSVSTNSFTMKGHSEKHAFIKETRSDSISNHECEGTKFKTPQHVKDSIGICSTIKTNVQSLTPNTQLNTWLSKNAMSKNAYHHLKCFGMSPEEIEEDKENIELKCTQRSESYESLRIKNQRESEQDQAGILDYKSIAKDALSDLYQLIQEGYSTEQCGLWLTMIRNKCNDIEEYPMYWECWAALEEHNNNLLNANLCYKSTISKGDKQNINESLNVLLQKFNLLKIDSCVKNNEKSTKRNVMDGKNIFNSTIVQFAIQEKEKKNENGIDRKLVATPVRRSTRLSKTPNARGIQLCSTFKDKDAENVDFKNNRFLSVRYN